MQAGPPTSEPDPLPAGNDVRLRVNLPFLAFVLAGLPLMAALGLWQLARAAEKEQALRLFEERRIAAPAPIATLGNEEPAGLDGRRVLLRGRYVAELAFLLDNRIFAARVGYELLMPFEDASGITVMVNRGWLLAPPTREQLPRVDTPGGDLELRGEIHVPAPGSPGEIMATAGWPSVVQSVDVPALSAHAGISTFAYLVRLEPGQPGVTEADWPRVNMTPDRHRAYATQWFLMAIALAVVFVSGGTNLGAWLKARRRKAGSQ